MTNDDGIDAAGLRSMVGALAPLAETIVVAPAENQSAVARGITLRRDLVVEEREVPGAVSAFAVDGTPVDCVRFAALGLAGPPPDAVVSGVNHGLNLGDDVTYSGTVAAAMEGLLLGLPAVAVSQQSSRGELGYGSDAAFDFEPAARFTARLLTAVLDRGFPADTALNVNCPHRPIRGAAVVRLGRRIYRDELELLAVDGRRRTYRIYGQDATYHEEPDTDFACIAEGRIAITPLHFDLGVPSAAERLAGLELEQLLDEAWRLAPAGPGYREAP